MEESRILIVYFSRSGNTERVACALQRALEREGVGCDLERLEESRSRLGLRGYLRSLRDSLRDRPAEVAPLRHDPADYTVVVVGTPVWAGAPSTPVRKFLRDGRSRLPRLACFLTHGGSSRERVFSAMARIANTTPISELAIREHDLARDVHTAKIQVFARDLAASAKRQAASGRVEVESLRSAEVTRR